MDIKSLFTPFPVLSTPRLILRSLRPSDLDDLYEYASDPEMDHYVPWEHYRNIEQARENLNEYLEEYEKDGLGAWGLQHRADNKLIGIISCSIPHRIHRRVEVGYAISRSYWGQGLATEAVKEFIRFGFKQMNLVRIEAVVLSENIASAKVLERSGMRLEGLLHKYQTWRGQPRDLLMYAIAGD